jgi:hypothetical protein
MVMTLFHGLICGIVALYTTRGLRSPCLMMAVRKRQNIVQWSYRRVPLNVLPRIPLLGYPDIDQGHILPDEGTCVAHRSGRFPGKETNYTAPETRASADGCAAQHGNRKANPGTGQHRDRSAVRRRSIVRACRQMKEPSEWIVPVAADGFAGPRLRYEKQDKP